MSNIKNDISTLYSNVKINRLYNVNIDKLNGFYIINVWTGDNITGTLPSGLGGNT